MLTNYQYGSGTLGSLQTGPNPAGGVFFVNSVIGNDNRGRVFFPGASTSQTQGSTQGPQMDASKPLATIGFALTFCLANRGDVIIVQEGHVETLAANLAINVAGLLVVGLGGHGSRPAITPAGFSTVISGAGCQMYNIAFNASTTAVTAGIVQLAANGAQAIGCKLVSSNVTTVGFAIGAANTLVDQCEVDATTTGASSAVLMGVFDGTKITGSNFHGIFAAAPIVCVANTNMLIQGNVLRQLSGSVAPVITGVVTATSGLVSDNRYQSVTAATAAAYLGGANVATNILVVYLQNYGFTGKAGPSSGILIPAVGTIP